MVILTLFILISLTRNAFKFLNIYALTGSFKYVALRKSPAYFDKLSPDHQDHSF